MSEGIRGTMRRVAVFLRAQLPAALALAAGLAVSFALFALIRQVELASLHRRFVQLAEDHALAIQARFTADREAIDSIGSFYAASKEVERDEFAVYVRATLRHHPAIRSVVWAPRVTGADRRTFEELLRRDGPGTRAIVERDASGALVEAGRRELHYPVYFAEPSHAPGLLPGFDFYSVPEHRVAMDTARATGELTASMTDSGEASWTFFLPISDAAPGSGGEHDRDSALGGFVVASYDPRRVLENALHVVRSRGLELWICDITTPSEARLLCASSGAERKPAAGPPEPVTGDSAWQRDFETAGRRYSLHALPASGFQEPYELWRSWTVLALGMVLSASLWRRSMTHLRRTQEVERLVEERTLELSREVRERGAAEKAHRESEERLALIVETIADGIVILRRDGQILFANTMAERILGLSRSSITERVYNDPAWEIAAVDGGPLPDEDLPFVRVMQSGDAVFGVELSVARGDGGRRILSVNAAPVREAGGEIGAVVASIRDVTERKQVERLKDDLVATVSHELRTPLSSLSGFVDLLLAREFPPEKQREFLEVVHSEAVRLTQLINDFLDIQRIESGRQVYHFEPVDVGPLIRQTLTLFRLPNERHSVRLDLPDGPIAALVDADRIRQVVQNLVSNAVKFSPEGGAITIRARVEDEMVHLSVADEGIGISPEHMENLFTKFYRADNEATRSIGGTGLGLALVKEIVAAHGGEVRVESEPSRGSTFHLSLPAGRRAHGPAAASHRDATAGEAADVLLVEDDGAFARVLVESFEVEGLSVARTDRGEDALQVARSASPRVTVLDIHLAGATDGWDVLVEFKEDPVLKAVPVLLISASESINARGLALAGADYLVKPISPAWLLEMVRCRLGATSGRSVLVADDDAVFRRHVRECLLAELDLTIDEAADGEEALAAIARRRPDLLILDLLMPKVDGFEVLRKLRGDRDSVNLPVLVVTGKHLWPEEKEYLTSRLAVLVRKRDASPQEIVRAARKVVEASATPA